VALSDLHIAYPENRAIISDLRPETGGDWLLIAGDVGELFEDIEWALTTLSKRFETVIWAPGNHELWTHPTDPVQLRGEERYRHLVELCRSLGVVTPEDPYRIWTGPGGPVTIAPLFLLYDYTFLPDGATNKEQAFTARLLVDGPMLNGARLAAFEGRWLVRDGLIGTAIVIRAAGISASRG
jgi:hypothetical protein